MPSPFAMLLMGAALLFLFENAGKTKEPEPPDPVPVVRLSVEDYDEISCLARNIFFEAREDRYWGMLAVAAATLNRVEKRRMSICSVVYQPGQFSWIDDLTPEEQKQAIVDEPNSWKLAKQIAKELYLNPNNKYKAPIEKRRHYYNPEKVKKIYKGRQLPRWIREGRDPVRVGSHIYVYVPA